MNNDGTVFVSNQNNATTSYSATLTFLRNVTGSQGFTDTGRGTTSDQSLQIDTSVLRLQNLTTPIYDTVRSLGASFTRVGDSVTIDSVIYMPLLRQSDRGVHLHNFTAATTISLGYSLPLGTTDLTVFKRGETLDNALLLYSTSGGYSLNANYLVSGAPAGTIGLTYTSDEFNGVDRFSINNSGEVAYSGVNANIGGSFIGKEIVVTQLNSIAAIPEPATWTIRAGLSALGFALIRRKKAA